MPSTKTKVNPGELNVPVDIQRRITVRDDTGGTSYDWETVWPWVYCKIESRPIVSIELGAGVISGVNHKVTMRYRDGIVSGMRLLNLATAQAMYAQTIIDVDSAHTWLNVYCVETEPREVAPVGGY